MFEREGLGEVKRVVRSEVRWFLGVGRMVDDMSFGFAG